MVALTKSRSTGLDQVPERFHRGRGERLVVIARAPRREEDGGGRIVVDDEHRLPTEARPCASQRWRVVRALRILQHLFHGEPCGERGVRAEDLAPQRRVVDGDREHQVLSPHSGELVLHVRHVARGREDQHAIGASMLDARDGVEEAVRTQRRVRADRHEMERRREREGCRFPGIALHDVPGLPAEAPAQLLVDLLVEVDDERTERCAGMRCRQAPGGGRRAEHAFAIGSSEQVRIALNAGYRGHAASTTTLPLRSGMVRDGARFTYGAGVSFRALESLDLVAETYGTHLFSDSAAAVKPSNEALGGRKLFVEKSSYLMLGAGPRYTSLPERAGHPRQHAGAERLPARHRRRRHS